MSTKKDKLTIVLRKAEQIREAIYESKLFPFDLCGACALASKELFEFGRKKRLPIQFCYITYDHCFNMFDNKVIDITAGQFLAKYMGEVAVLAKREAKKHYIWKKPDVIASNKREFKRANIQVIQLESWDRQSPILYEFVNEDGKLKLIEKKENRKFLKPLKTLDLFCSGNKKL